MNNCNLDMTGMRLKDRTSSERQIQKFRKYGTACMNSITYTVISLAIKKIYNIRRRSEVTNIAEINYGCFVQLRYEQYYAEIEGGTSTFSFSSTLFPIALPISP